MEEVVIVNEFRRFHGFVDEFIASIEARQNAEAASNGEDESAMMVRIPLDRIPSRNGARVAQGCSDSPKPTLELSKELDTTEPLSNGLKEKAMEPTFENSSGTRKSLDQPLRKRSALEKADIVERKRRKSEKFVQIDDNPENHAQQRGQLVVRNKTGPPQAVSLGDNTSNLGGANDNGSQQR